MYKDNNYQDIKVFRLLLDYYCVLISIYFQNNFGFYIRKIKVSLEVGDIFSENVILLYKLEYS